MKTEIIEKETARFLSILRLAKDQKLSEEPRLTTLMNEQIKFLDEDLNLFIQVLKSNNALDLLRILMKTKNVK